LGVRDGALVVLPNGGGVGDGGVEEFPMSWRRWSPSLVALAAELYSASQVD
jgi:hypothetical protein